MPAIPSQAVRQPAKASATGQPAHCGRRQARPAISASGAIAAGSSQPSPMPMRSPNRRIRLMPKAAASVINTARWPMASTRERGSSRARSDSSSAAMTAHHGSSAVSNQVTYGSSSATSASGSPSTAASVTSQPSRGQAIGRRSSAASTAVIAAKRP